MNEIGFWYHADPAGPLCMALTTTDQSLTDYDACCSTGASPFFSSVNCHGLVQLQLLLLPCARMQKSCVFKLPHVYSLAMARSGHRYYAMICLHAEMHDLQFVDMCLLLIRSIWMPPDLMVSLSWTP